QDMERCRVVRAYWCLLHVVVCLPDICAALQSPNGENKKPKYIAWCDQYLKDAFLSSAERYYMRCKVLHQGYASTDPPSRYTGFAFGQPSDSGVIDHKRAENDILHLDVGEFARETWAGVNSWISRLESNPTVTEARNVA